MLFSFTKCSAIVASLILLSSTVLTAPINESENIIDETEVPTEALETRSHHKDDKPIPQREDDACIRVGDSDLQFYKPHLNNWSLSYQTIDGNKAWRSSDLTKGWSLSSPSNTRSCDNGIWIQNSGHEAAEKNMFRVNPKDGDSEVWYWLDRHDYCRIIDLPLDKVGGVEIHTL